MGILDNIFGTNWIADLFNPNHQPGGTPIGGQFAPATGGASGGMGGGSGQTTTPNLDNKRAAASKRLHDWQNNTDRGKNELGGARAYPGDKIDAGAYGKHYVVGEHGNYYLVVDKRPTTDRKWEDLTADPPLNGAIHKSTVKRVIQTAYNNGLEYHPPLEYRGKGDAGQPPEGPAGNNANRYQPPEGPTGAGRQAPNAPKKDR